MKVLDNKGLRHADNRRWFALGQLGISLTLATLLFTSCLTDKSRSGTRADGAFGGTDNSQASVQPGFGRILEDNPIILSRNKELAADANLGAFLRVDRQEYITDRQFLEGQCNAIAGICFEVRQDENKPKTQNSSRRWAYPTKSPEFLEVNTFGHMKRMLNLFHDNLRTSFQSRTFSASPPEVINYRTALPANLFESRAHWKNKPLVGFADSSVKDNAFFSPATFTFSMGVDSEFPTVKFAQDPTVIYHEIGHALVSVKSNIRNRAAGLVVESDLGYYFYDEAGSINEGIADYYSYVMNGRTHFGEWALGRFIGQSRPMSERDKAHAPGISATREGRLSYPTFLSYDPNRPEGSFEDIHYAGQIISHYLVALTELFIKSCGMNQQAAVQSVLYLLTETLAELGDLTAKGSDHNPGNQINLDGTFNPKTQSLNSMTWIKTARPIDYRRFAQTMAKFQVQFFGDPIFNRCNGKTLTKDSIERLLDDYGLLLFRTYAANRNSLPGPAISVSVANRVRSELISKNVVKLDPRDGRPQAFIFDDRVQMVSALESLVASGQITESISTQIESDLPFNNGNARISPGEFVGVALNIFNDSNSPIAGVEVLANDWDHTKGGKLCSNLGDNFPLESEGAASSDNAVPAPGDCGFITRNNGIESGAGPHDSIAPVCFVQQLDGSATEWVNQENFRKSIPGIEPNDCLGGVNSGMNCFIRFPRGADKATYSKINPKRTFAETITGEDGVGEFNISNILFMEVNKKTPPGTTFNCRLRVRFTNCDDCWHDPDTNQEYEDFEFSGPRPFKLINFRFTVID
jgi:hypothetical protein